MPPVAADVPVVWLSEAHVEHPPSPAESSVFARWASQHNVRPRAASDTNVAPRVEFDEALSQEIERALAAALDARTAEQPTRGLEILERAEALLAKHPELPHAAWLLAEVERARSGFRRLLQAGEGEWSRAARLDGGRRSGIGEPTEEGDLPEALELFVVRERPTDEVWVDGRPFLRNWLAAGVHQLVVVRGTEIVLARWLDHRRRETIEVPSPAGACERADLLRAPAMVDCPEWISARADKSGRLLTVLTCAFETCTTVATLPVEQDGSARDPKHRRPWVTYALVGAGVATLAVGAWVAFRVLEPPTRQTHFVSGGLENTNFAWRF